MGDVKVDWSICDIFRSAVHSWGTVARPDCVVGILKGGALPAVTAATF